MTTLPNRKPSYKACSTEHFRAEFGVCRGEAISRLDDLNLGDIYLVKREAEWTEVTPVVGDTATFHMNVAANLPNQKLVTLAHLIFMTTNGRRADVFATISNGQMHIVSDEPLAVGHEYVLIDIQLCDVDIDALPEATPATVAPMAQYGSNVVALRLIG